MLLKRKEMLIRLYNLEDIEEYEKQNEDILKDNKIQI